MYEALITALLKGGAKCATKYVSPSEVIRVTRRVYRHKRGKFHGKPIELVVTHGKPNYLEREFIRQCRKAGESFPVRKVQFKFPSSAGTARSTTSTRKR